MRENESASIVLGVAAQCEVRPVKTKMDIDGLSAQVFGDGFV